MKKSANILFFSLILGSIVFGCATQSMTKIDADRLYNTVLSDIEKKWKNTLDNKIDSISSHQFVLKNYTYPGMQIRNEFIRGNRKLKSLFRKQGYSDYDRISAILLKSYYEKHKCDCMVSFDQALE